MSTEMIPAVQPQSHARFLSPPKKKARTSRIRRVTHVMQGVITVLKRRGVGYFWYLAVGYLWPALAYRLFFSSAGPKGHPAMRVLRLLQTSGGSGGASSEPRSVEGQCVIDLSELPGDSSVWASVERELNRIHAGGVTGVAFGLGDVSLNPVTQSVTFSRVSTSRLHRSTSGLCFRYWRDRDRQEFNRRFRRSLLTEKSARARLRQETRELERSTPYGGWYAGIDFGGGITVDNFAGTNNGTGRWEFLNGPVVAPLVRGKRVLDLGSNNGVLSVMMLRAGAREVVGVELSPAYARAAHVVREMFEWRDMKEYRLSIKNQSMLDVLAEDWGRFDVVTAFCSLYCVEEEYMEQIVRKCAGLAPVMILQANMPKPGMQAHHPRAAAPFLKQLLERSGYSDVEMFAPIKFARPLLVGRNAVR